MSGFGFIEDKSKSTLAEIVNLFENNAPTDYFDFPFSLGAFALSLSSSELFVYKSAMFRKRNLHLTLITYFCTGEELAFSIKMLAASGYKIKSLNFANKDMTGLVKKKYQPEYWIDKNWDFQAVLAGMKKRKSRYKRKRELDLCEKKYSIEEAPEEKEAFELFDEWVEGAKPRHFMVIKGHYKKYIEMIYSTGYPSAKLISFRNNSTGELFGLAGYEVFKGSAQITLMKHKFGDANFPLFFWVKTLETILSEQVEKVFCGTTADELKTRLKFNKQDSFKVAL